MKSISMLVGLMTIFLASIALNVAAVPGKIGKVPSWWFTGVTAQNICNRNSKCGPEECCVRPLLSANSYCMPMKKRGDICNPSSMMLDPDNEVYFSDCPCQQHLNCVGLQTRSVCVDLNDIEFTIQRLESQGGEKKTLPRA